MDKVEEKIIIKSLYKIQLIVAIGSAILFGILLTYSNSDNSINENMYYILLLGMLSLYSLYKSFYPSINIAIIKDQIMLKNQILTDSNKISSIRIEKRKGNFGIEKNGLAFYIENSTDSYFVEDNDMHLPIEKVKNLIEERLNLSTTKI